MIDYIIESNKYSRNISLASHFFTFMNFNGQRLSLFVSVDTLPSCKIELLLFVCAREGEREKKKKKKSR